MVLLPVLEFVDFEGFELGFMYLLYIIPLFSLLGVWGHAEYVGWVQTRGGNRVNRSGFGSGHFGFGSFRIRVDVGYDDSSG